MMSAFLAKRNADDQVLDRTKHVRLALHWKAHKTLFDPILHMFRRKLKFNEGLVRYRLQKALRNRQSRTKLPIL